MGSSEVSSDHTDFGYEWNDNGPNNVNDATATANANISDWTTNFTDKAIEPLGQWSLFTWKIWCFCDNSIRLLQPII